MSGVRLQDTVPPLVAGTLSAATPSIAGGVNNALGVYGGRVVAATG